MQGPHWAPRCSVRLVGLTCLLFASLGVAADYLITSDPDLQVGDAAVSRLAKSGQVAVRRTEKDAIYARYERLLDNGIGDVERR